MHEQIVTIGGITAPKDLARLMRLGVRAFPTRADKRPCFKGWQESATADLQTLGAQYVAAGSRYGGLGLITGEVVSVLDVDDPFGAMDVLRDLAAEADDQFPEAGQLIGHTPRGGLHLFYLSPDPGADVGNTHLHDLAVDWRGKGNLVMSFGLGRSMEGHVVPAVPTWLRAWLRSAKPRRAHREVEAHGPAVLTRAVGLAHRVDVPRAGSR